MSQQSTLVSWPPSEVPVQNPDQRDRNDPTYLQHFHNQFCPDIAKNGVLVPLIVAIVMGVKTLLDGETRRRAALFVGLKEVPVLLLEGRVAAEDVEIIKYRANKKRLGYSKMDEARFFLATMRTKGWTQARLCAELDLDPSHVSKLRKVLEKTCESLRDRIGDGDGMLSLRAAYAICDEPPEQQVKWANRLLAQEIGVEELERQLADAKGRKMPKPKATTFRQRHTNTVIQTADYDAAIAEQLALVETLRRAQKAGLPLNSAVQMMRQSASSS